MSYRGDVFYEFCAVEQMRQSDDHFNNELHVFYIILPKTLCCLG